MKLLFVLIGLLYTVVSNEISYKCHDPALGGYRGSRKVGEKKFILISGAGAGIGNFLVFFPAAYYFAALTGREILIHDQSIIGEMCTVLHCGFPMFSAMASTFPSIFNDHMLNNVRGAKVGDFHRYLQDPLDDKLIRADGYMEQSGWYSGHKNAGECISLITGCSPDDHSCHDRHALQQLVRGPFKTAFSIEEEKKIIGVPANYKHGILTLPHEYAPRLDAAVHLRCQFQHFEWLVGKEDSMWENYVKEVDEFLNSPAPNRGKGLFQEIEGKIMRELTTILSHRRNNQRKRKLLATKYINTVITIYEKMYQNNLEGMNTSSRRNLLENSEETATSDSSASGSGNSTQFRLDLEHEQELYHGSEDQSDRVYVYLAADNERVKEAFAEYLLGHHNISVMRVRTGSNIVHAKNTGYLRQTSDGVMALVVDWYSLSLANVLFAWRRDTGLTSTFARSAQKVSGNSESIALRLNTTSSDSRGSGSSATLPASERARMFQLTYGRNNNAVWSEH